jgi:hypothetical protein
METSEFEKKLAAQPFRPPPASWRAEILQQARLASAFEVSRPEASVQTEGRESRPSGTRTAWALALLGFFHPSRQGWAGLAAAWLIIFFLNYLAGKPAGGETESSNAAYVRVAVSYYQNQHRMTELFNPEFPEPAVRPKSHPGPRSHRAPDTVHV